MIDKIGDYNINLELMLEQWKSSEKLKGVISASMTRANDMEDAIFEVRDLMDIDNGEGLSLDYIGKVWNTDREGNDDAAYRILLKQTKAKSFSGEPESIIEILKATYGATFVQYSPEYPGKYRLVTDAFLSQSILDNISVAGVGAVLGGAIIDANGNNIVDANGNRLIHINSTP